MLVATSGGPLERSWQLVAAVVFLVMASGCATNHDFVRGAELDLPGLVNTLETKSEEDDALFDITFVPLVHQE